MNNIISYYEKGYFITKLTPKNLKKLKDYFNGQTWVDDHSSRYNTIPLWCSKFKDLSIVNNTGKNDFDFYAEQHIHKEDILRSICNDINGQEELDFLRSDHNQYNFSCWNGARDLDWHWDGFDYVADYYILCYIPMQELNKDTGGSISFGIRDYIDESNPRFDTPRLIEEIYPTEGLCVIINNSNPRFVHKVKEIKDKNIHRYTLSCEVLKNASMES